MALMPAAGDGPLKLSLLVSDPVLKARYVAYTDAAFTVPLTLPSAAAPAADPGAIGAGAGVGLGAPSDADGAGRWAHLGLLGPVLRAAVRVTLRNRTPAPATVHPHGVLYAKASEGAPYADGLPRGHGGDWLPPNATVVYTWHVPASAGPGPGDPSSLLWLYHGHLYETRDENAGLVGAILVTRRGAATGSRVAADADAADADAADAAATNASLGGSDPAAAAAARRAGAATAATLAALRPRDVDREFVVLFKSFEESGSLPDLAAANAHLWPPRGSEGAADEYNRTFVRALNGRAFCSLPGLALQAGERVRWYVAALGNEIDLHWPHWSGAANTMRLHGGVGAGVSGTVLLPATMRVLDMPPPQAPGSWLLSDLAGPSAGHGMQARYTVVVVP